MRAMLLAGLAAPLLAACSTSGPVATYYAPAAYTAGPVAYSPAPVQIETLSYLAEPSVVAPAPVAYRTAEIPVMPEPIDAYVREPEVDPYDPASLDAYPVEETSGGCSELVVC